MSSPYTNRTRTEGTVMIQPKGDLLTANPTIRTLLDAMPIPALIVDGDSHIRHLNVVASQYFETDSDAALSKRSGELLECLHATETPEGCGRAKHCESCVVRHSIAAGIEQQQVYRRHAAMQLHNGGDVREFHLLVTVTPFKYERQPLVLLALEDITELIQLRGFLPICTSCKKVRADESYLEQIELYLHNRPHVDFSHGLCP
ncbi:MAG: hypothetical protein ACYSTL_03415, partial [Planctomycetota bacterium]